MNKFQSYRQMSHYKQYLSNYRTVQKDTKNILSRKPDWDYNCFGYAVGFYDWLDLDNFCYSDEEDFELLEEMALDCANEVVSRIKHSRLITRPEMADRNERVIAFRLGHDDFHFARLNSDGVWTHKPGSNTVRVMSEEELYGDEWCPHRCCPYISTVYFIAIRKGSVKFR